jgi:hypothetical protein
MSGWAPCGQNYHETCPENLLLCVCVCARKCVMDCCTYSASWLRPLMIVRYLCQKTLKCGAPEIDRADGVDVGHGRRGRGRRHDQRRLRAVSNVADEVTHTGAYS